MKTGLICAVVLVAMAAFAPAVGSNAHANNHSGAAMTGDYLFEEWRFRAVFLTHVYERDGSVYAQLDIVDRPSELVAVDGADDEYSMDVGGSKNRFVASFVRDADGRVTELSLTNEANGVEMTGKRVDLPLARLRDRYESTASEYVYEPPLEIEGDWPVGSLEETGIDPGPLHEMMADISQSADFMQSILVVKDGKLVFEEYMNGWDPLRLHRLQSVTKSVTSTMAGLAISEGLIGSVQDPLRDYLPEYAELFDEAKSKILIEHLLTMTGGFEWNEDATYYAKPEDCDAHLAMASGDFIQYVLEKPLVNEPGTVFEYNSGFPNMLGYIIEQRADMNLLEFADAHLFEPLGIERAYWQPESGIDRPGCAGGLRLTSRDMARYGLLYLQDGMWNGEQLLDPEWVRESVRWQLDAYEGGYGYFWKRYVNEDIDAFLASGTGGQFIVCIPALDAVVVTTAQFNTDKDYQVVGLLLSYVVPALMAS